MIYGYCRVSTLRQATKGNSLDDQRRALKEAGAEIIISDSYTGTKIDRPNFSQLLNEIKPGDKLIVTKLDRFARTAVDGVNIVRQLQAQGIAVHILNMGLLDDTPTGKLMTTMLLAFAEFERDMIVERTQAGKAVARANGKKVDGRPKKFSHAQRDLAMKLLSDGDSYSEVERKTGISKSTLVREARARKMIAAVSL